MIFIFMFMTDHHDLFRGFDAVVEQVSPKALKTTRFARRRDPGGEIEF